MRIVALGCLFLLGGCAGAGAGAGTTPSAKQAPPEPPTPAVAPTPTPASPAPEASEPGLDKEEIRAVIRTAHDQVEYCYQKQLLRNAKLAGRVTVVFRIVADGTVDTVSASGLGDATVESCVAEVIRALHFPHPRNAAFVNVTYPFEMRSHD